MAEEPLVSISEASQMLGVSEAALRQWTDEGKIKAFITPGGHRRYSKAALKKYIGSHPRMLGIKDLVAELEETAPLLREIARGLFKSTTWYEKLNKESKERLAVLGRHLLNLIIKCVTEPSRREETMQTIQNAGHDLGETLAKLELPLTDSVEVFLMHRDPIMKVTAHMMKRREAFTGRVVEAIPLVARVMDEALVALVAAHQQYHSEPKGKIDGGAAG
ncbi:helix-turn-helix domain-containing protein [Chloroflexota bacterium]